MVLRVDPRKLTPHGTILRSCEASCLGLPPGEWPNHIFVDGAVYVRVFIAYTPNDDIESVLYRHPSTEREVIVFND